MAFWRFGFAQDSAIDTLLKEWEASCAAATGISSSPSKSTGNDAARPEQSTSSSSSILKTATAHTLDQLLDEDDLLQECKAGHAKLVSVSRFHDDKEQTDLVCYSWSFFRARTLWCICSPTSLESYLKSRNHRKDKTSIARQIRLRKIISILKMICHHQRLL